jgi:N-acetyl-anhydromuramyl-L-alanine amidase AmpD
MKTLKLKSTGPLVDLIQNFLNIKVDGYFGPKTQRAVIQFQVDNKLFPDGIVGEKTYLKMLEKGFMRGDIQMLNNFYIEYHYLPEQVYFKVEQNKKWIFLHHTNGWHNPFKVIDEWARHPEKKVATEFVIGGLSIKNDNEDIYDGKILHAIPDKFYAWHIGIGNQAMHRESIGIELCNFGNLTKGYFNKKKNGKLQKFEADPNKFYTSYGQEVHANQVETLKEPFRGYLHWHKYSDEQLKELKNLLQYLSYTYKIDIRKGLPQLVKQMGAQAFDIVDIHQCRNTPGLWSHTNVSAQKFDVAPQEGMMNLLFSI